MRCPRGSGVTIVLAVSMMFATALAAQAQTAPPAGQSSPPQPFALLTPAEWQQRYAAASHRKHVAEAVIATAVTLAVTGLILDIRGQHPDCASRYEPCINAGLGEVESGLALLAAGAIFGRVGQLRLRRASAELDWLEQMRKAGFVKVAVGPHSVGVSVTWAW